MQQEQPKNSNKEKCAEMPTWTTHHKAPQQNTHIEDPLSLYDDGTSDGMSDEEGRYIVEFCFHMFTFQVLNINEALLVNSWDYSFEVSEEMLTYK